MKDKVFVRRVLLTAGCAGLLFGQKQAKKNEDVDVEEDVSPAEDLMREHGVLKRVLLIYDEAGRRLESGKDLPASVVTGAATLIRDFIEGYHEKLEEDYLFPRFRKAGQQIDLVNVLQQQHEAGRRVTQRILQDCRNGLPKDESGRRDLRTQLYVFVRMYGPHEAREDTVLFPALRRIVSPHEYDSLGEEFEKKEHQLFGEDGFERNVERVAGLEKQLGIYDLSQFTPKG